MVFGHNFSVFFDKLVTLSEKMNESQSIALLTPEISYVYKQFSLINYNFNLTITSLLLNGRFCTIKKPLELQ